MNELKVKRKQDKSDMNTNMAKLNTLGNQNATNIKLINNEIYNIAQLLQAMLEAEKINQRLQIQDEEDRHSIALWGTNKVCFGYFMGVLFID